MADISIEIAAIQTATHGSELRSAIAAALIAINNDIPPVYSGSYSLLPSTVSYTVPVSGFRMAQDLVVEAYPEPILISKTITENGTYHASSDNADGYSQVTVSIPYYGGPYSITPSTVSQTFYTTDLMMAQDLVVEAYPEPVLISKTASGNGVYTASDDNADGYSQFTVAIPEYSGPYVITPSTVSQTFQVQDMVMTQNLTVEAVEDTWDQYLNLQLRSFTSNIQTLKASMFWSQSLLSYVSLPECKTIGAAAFYACRILPEIYLPKCSQITTSLFTGCSSLSTIRFDVLSTITGGGHFRACSNLTALYLLWSGVCDISSAASTSAFNGTPILSGSGFIYVPSSLYSAYITHSVWGTWSFAFRSYTE